MLQSGSGSAGRSHGGTSVDVATGGSPIDTVNPRYRRRRRQLNAALQSRAIATPFAFEDLWAWRGYWKAQDLTTYQSRRDRISQLARPARDRLESALADPKPGAARLRLADDDDGSRTYESVHRGARAFAEGLYAAIRNPGMHTPTDGGEEQVALEQLAAFSLLARWVDQAELRTGPTWPHA